jgi:UDP-GlcNAc:undecaprenyl-phosphate/decaprenyl-phosphate GlcNAc-1-phosphate transferase
MTNLLIFSFIIPLVFSFIISFVTTPIVIKLYKKLGFLDDPKNQHHPKVVHKYPVPRGGGIPILITLILGCLIFLPLYKPVLAILLSGIVIVVVGSMDDIFDINPYFRLLTNLIAAGIIVGAGVGISYITNPLGGIIHLDSITIPLDLFGRVRNIVVIADLFAVVWIVWTMNMVNWAKGLDGQMPGVVSISAIVVGILSFRFFPDNSQVPVVVISALTAGAFFGFLPFNFYPQKIMPGYGGGALAGFLLAVLSIMSSSKVATMMLVLGVPFMDAVYTIIRRVAARKSPVWGDRGHLHHRLMDLGWGKRRIALFYWLISAILGAVALTLDSRGKLFATIMIFLIVGGGLLWITNMSSKSSKQ